MWLLLGDLNSRTGRLDDGFNKQQESLDEQINRKGHDLIE